MADLTKTIDFDPYEMLGMENAVCEEKDLTKAFRKMALRYHPDKNPDNKEYAEKMFLKLSKAFEILSDPAARAAYDRLRTAKQAARERNNLLDAKRRKLKEELERREAGAVQRKSDEEIAEKKLEEEIARLRKEGSKLLQREKEEINRQVHRDQATQGPSSGPRATPSEDDTYTPYSGVSNGKSPARLKLKWRAKKNDSSNGGYSHQKLEEIFQKYGIINGLVVSKKKNGSAILEYATPNSGVLATNLETGDSENPIEITWISGKPDDSTENSEKTENTEKTETTESNDTSNVGGFKSFQNEENPNSASGDFESLVLMKLRQAEERKRLIAELEKEDDEVTVIE